MYFYLYINKINIRNFLKWYLIDKVNLDMLLIKKWKVIDLYVLNVVMKFYSK